MGSGPLWAITIPLHCFPSAPSWRRQSRFVSHLNTHSGQGSKSRMQTRCKKPLLGPLCVTKPSLDAANSPWIKHSDRKQKNAKQPTRSCPNYTSNIYIKLYINTICAPQKLFFQSIAESHSRKPLKNFFFFSPGGVACTCRGDLPTATGMRGVELAKWVNQSHFSKETGSFVY